MNTARIREISNSELGILEDMLYEAIYQPDEAKLIPKSVLNIPEVYAYIQDFGSKPDDFCMVAECDGKIVGAVWVRIIAGAVKGYGNVDSNTPEFAISLYKEYRGKGTGSQLMYAMINHLRTCGYKQASLNVKKENYAVQLYKKVGFEVTSESEEDYLMVIKFR